MNNATAQLDVVSMIANDTPLASDSWMLPLLMAMETSLMSGGSFSLGRTELALAA